MGTIASQITSLAIVYSIVYSSADQRKHQSSASLAFVWGIHRGPVNSPHKWPVTRKMFKSDDVIMTRTHQQSGPLHKRPSWIGAECVWECTKVIQCLDAFLYKKDRLSGTLMVWFWSYPGGGFIKGWHWFKVEDSTVMEVCLSSKPGCSLMNWLMQHNIDTTISVNGGTSFKREGYAAVVAKTFKSIGAYICVNELDDYWYGHQAITWNNVDLLSRG